MRNAFLEWLFQSRVLATIIAHTFVMGLAVIGLLLYSWLFGLPSFVVNAAPVDVEAASEPQATAMPENPCAEWGLAGAQTIFKCIDEEPPYAICYVPVGGVMQCLKD